VTGFWQAQPRIIRKIAVWAELEDIYGSWSHLKTMVCNFNVNVYNVALSHSPANTSPFVRAEGDLAESAAYDSVNTRIQQKLGQG
jgi:hypothetical protein